MSLNPIATANHRSLTEIPIDVIATIAIRLDLCSLWNLLDTCSYLRYNLMPYRSIWRRIVVDLKYCDLSQFYAALRRLKDSNGLRRLIQEVCMDGNDDSMISPLIMLVKFPNLKRLSARYRRFNTDLKVDTKLLQEMLKSGQLQPNSLPLERMDIYHYYMAHEPHLDVFSRTLDRLSFNDHVQLDIKECGRARSTTDELIDALDNLNLMACTRIVATDARCCVCGYNFVKCWLCESNCPGCRSKRLPPLVNDKMNQSGTSNPTNKNPSTTSRADSDDTLSLDEFSFFE
ncbi:hypothetical protein BX666DRAFT_1963800 [Dichotomocladium elegans]|nr:hypothetical protein BX666DRAFT_1963800 [Dichotomocladium elegans]